MRLIDADALGIGPCNPDLLTDPGYARGWNNVIKIIENAPTIDPVYAAGVCHCRECRHQRIGLCYLHDEPEVAACPTVVKPDHFCSHGERKETDDG